MMLRMRWRVWVLMRGLNNGWEHVKGGSKPDERISFCFCWMMHELRFYGVCD
jgi:hypothetical protein